MEQGQQPSLTFSNASKTCCGILQAPSPKAQTWAGSFAVAAVPAVASGLIPATQLFQNERSLDAAGDSSPPPLRSLLCTFLI